VRILSRRFPAILRLSFLLAAPSLLAVDVPVFVPVVLSVGGEGGSVFTSEITYSNKGTTDVTAEVQYTAELGGGSGTVSFVVAAGRQVVIDDAIADLRQRGLAIPADGARLGTLLVRFRNASSTGAVAATVRTTTPVPPASPVGRAGLAYAGIPTEFALTGPALLGGLQVNSVDRSNVALQNAGSTDVTLRLSYYEGSSPSATPIAVRSEMLGPYRFRQLRLTDIHGAAQQGWLKVERTAGTGPYYAYGVINSNANSDGSFVAPVPEATLAGRRGLTLPVAVETGVFGTEVAIANATAQPKTVRLTYYSSSIDTGDHSLSLDVPLAAGEQRILDGFVARLRATNPTAAPAGRIYTGPVVASMPSADLTGILLGARVLNPGGGGSYGLFFQARPYGLGVPYAPQATEAFLYGLQQDVTDRTNLALLNTGEADNSTIRLRVEIFDGETGQKVATVEGPDTTLAPRGFTQLNQVLKTFAPAVRQAYVRVTRISGSNPFVAYGVVNDGAEPGQRSGDGAFVSMETAYRTSARYTGTWNNVTFGSTGPAQVDLAVRWFVQEFDALVTLGGNVFGGAPPAPFTLSASFAAGSTSVGTISTPFGLCTFQPLGRTPTTVTFSATCTQVPSASISGFDFSGSVSDSSMQGVYTARFTGGGSANGTFNMPRVP
jgi:hypothetical protein